MRALGVVAASMLAACASAGGGPMGGEQAMREVARGFHGGRQSELFEFVTDGARYEALVGRLPRAGAVDFDQEAVIVAFQGGKPTGGYAVIVERAERRGDVLEVTLALHEPGPGCMTTQALTQPYHIVAVPRGATSARFTTRRVAEPCG